MGTTGVAISITSSGVARFEALARFADFLGQFIKFYAHRIGPFQRSLLPFLPRDQFLALVGVRSATLNQRVATGEAAFALGCHKPAHIGEYFVLDAFAMILASMLNWLLRAHGQGDRKQSRW